MYFDIDNCENAIDEKAKLIEKYPECISMICVSSSGTGLSFFVKIENEITSRNFYSIRQYLCATIFKDLNLDPNTSAISNAWYVSYDPDCSHNPSAVIEIPEENIQETERKSKSANATINKSSIDIVPNALYKYRFIDINQVLLVLKFQTEVQVKNRIFDIEPIEYCEVFMNKGYSIPDKRKKQVFAQIIHSLIYLNPDVHHDYIVSYLVWLNENKTETPAKRGDVVRWFDHVLKNIQKTGELRAKIRIKYFHCREKTIAPSIRKTLAIRMVNLYKRQMSIYQITLAKQIIELQKSANATINNTSYDIVPNAPSLRATQFEVFRLIKERSKLLGVKGIGIRTIKKYWNEEPVDIEEIIEIENQRMVITYITPNEDWEAPAIYAA